MWGGAMTITKSGNLLMMPSRVRDDGEWMRLSAALVDVGVEAAEDSVRPGTRKRCSRWARKIYNVCTECHMKYITE